MAASEQEILAGLAEHPQHVPETFDFRLHATQLQAPRHSRIRRQTKNVAGASLRFIGSGLAQQPL